LNVIVSGANGWLGRSSIWSISQIQESNSIYAVTRNKKNSIEQDLKIKSFDYNDVLFENFLVDGFIHLPFITRDKVGIENDNDYISENLKLISWALEVIRKHKPKWIISISSGAVYKNGDNTSNELELNVEKNPYGFLKNIEETLIKTEAEKINSNYVCARLWGATGEDIQNYKPYAIGDFISSAIKSNAINVKSTSNIKRNFVDTRQLMTILINEAMAGNNLTIDSYGNEISIRDLAQKVGSHFEGCSVNVPERYQIQESDNYVPLKDDFLELYPKWGIDKLTIDEQISVTIKGIKRLLG
jgi:nucleoside-diphosphate-sugar epimerase